MEWRWNTFLNYLDVGGETNQHQELRAACNGEGYQQFPPDGFSSEKTLVLISHFANPSRTPPFGPPILTLGLMEWLAMVLAPGEARKDLSADALFFQASTAISPRFPTRGPASSKSPG